MASLDIPGNPLVEALALAFAVLIDSGEVDLLATPDSDETEVQADAWTLHVEGWPLTTAWIAIDQDPVSPAEQRAALFGMFGHRELAALHDADRRLEGKLLRCLRASGDQLSIRLTELLDMTQPPDRPPRDSA